MRNEDNQYIGSGWNFPLKTDAAGKIKLSTGSEDIEQAIHIILETSPGERVMRPLFGCRARDMLFRSVNAETITLMTSAVEEALALWEPRILIHDVHFDVDPSQNNLLICNISYEINATHDTRNIVHPFYIEKEPEII